MAHPVAATAQLRIQESAITVAKHIGVASKHGRPALVTLRESVEYLERWHRFMRGWVEPAREIGRSEEHTSELQSRGHLVCRLLLEKKKNHYQQQRTAHKDTTSH